MNAQLSGLLFVVVLAAMIWLLRWSNRQR